MELSLSKISKVVLKGSSWPKKSSVCWSTPPELIKALCTKGIIPNAFITSGEHWDPFYLDGKVLEVYEELGFKMRHRNENFWKVWPVVLKPNTFIITNPPFGSGMKTFLASFFDFLVTFDRPFVVLLPDKIVVRDYFGKAFARIRQPQDLHIWGLNKCFYLENVAEGRRAPFTGLTVIAYYKKEWNFDLDKTNFEHIFNKQILHWK